MDRQTFLITGLFLIVLATLSITYNINKPRIMILHSYHPDYAWTRDVNVGIERVANDWGRYRVIWHYMDTKKYHDERWRLQAGLIAKRAIENAEPDVLIIIDDLAQQLVGKDYVNHPSIQIVFAGVNGSIESYNYENAHNVTGIYERKQLQAIKETVVTLEQNREQKRDHPRLAYIIDESTSLKQGLPYFERFDWKPLNFIEPIHAETYDEWKSAIKNIEQTADYLLVANYRNIHLDDNNLQVPPPSEIMTWTESNSAIPVIGVNVFNTEEGAMMSVGVSPYEQGEVAASIAERIIEEDLLASTIPIQNNKHYVVAINNKALQKRGIVMPSIYEAFGRATANFYE